MKDQQERVTFYGSHTSTKRLLQKIYIYTCWCYEVLEAQYAIEERKQPSGIHYMYMNYS